MDTITVDIKAEYLKLGTRDRPLSLALHYPEGIRDDVLLPQRVVGRESIFGGLGYTLLCVCADPDIPVKEFIGRPAELRIVTDRGGRRRLCGIVSAASAGQSDGALATYELLLSDGLALMEGRSNMRVFRNKSELDIVTILVKEWRHRNRVFGASFDVQIDAGLGYLRPPQREFIMQYNESDAAFIRRLLQRRGIGWFFRPGLPAPSPSDAIGHTLVIFDDVASLKQNSAGTVRFHRDASTEERDAVNAWSAVRTLQPGTVGLHSWDYKYPVINHQRDIRATTRADQGECGNEIAALLEDYRVMPPHAGDSFEDLDLLGWRMASRHLYDTKCFYGEGGVRDLAVGEWIGLQGHPQIDSHPQAEREFVITAQDIAARNNLPVTIGERVERLFDRNGWNAGKYVVFAGEELRRNGYRTRFSCVRRGIPLVPPAPVITRPAMQSAIVVGPTDGEVRCDELGRVRIRFTGTRPDDHAHASGAGSSDSENDSAWVRVASSWAGSGGGPDGHWGVRMLPAAGTEVLVDFVGGDTDKPVIVGQLYNSVALPPAFRGDSALPTSLHQSGIRSHEVRGARGNQLRLDDTPGQISAQLGSDHACSELNLGFLTEARRDGPATPRGEGAELRSDEAIALLAAKGILLSAWKVLGSGKGRQLARDDHLALLRECGQLCEALGEYAAEHAAMPAEPKEQADLLARFERWEDGSNTAPQATERGTPVIGLSSPAGIAFSSAKTIVSYSARNIDSAAQQHLQLTAGQRFSLNAGKGISIFAQHGGLHAIAHNGKLLLQSQHDDTDIQTAKNLTLSASEGTATISAKVILLVAEDGSFLKLGDGAPVLGSKQDLKFHAPNFKFDGPETMTAQLPAFDTAGVDQKFDVRFPPGVPLENGDQPDGAAVENARLLVELSDGTQADLRSGADGKSELVQRDAMHIADVTLMRAAEDR